MSRRWAWLAGIFLASVFAHLVYLEPGGPWARGPDPLEIGRDEGTVLYDSFRIASGQVMYRDFFRFQGPVFYYLHAGVFSIFGPSVAAARALQILVAALSSVLLFAIASRVAGRLAGLSAAAIHAFLLFPMWPYAYPHWYAEAMALGALALLLGRPSPRREVAAGALLGTAAATILSLGAPLLVALAGAAAIRGGLARRWREGLGSAGRVLGGAAAVMALIAILLALGGALDEAIEDVLVFPFGHYGVLFQGGYAPRAETFVAAHQVLDPPWDLLGSFGILVVLALPIAALPGLALAGWRMLAALAASPPPRPSPASGGGSKGPHARHRHLPLAAASAAALAPLFFQVLRTDLTHMAFLGSFSLCAVALLAAAAQPHPRLARAAGVALAACALALALSYAGKTALTWSASRDLPSLEDQIRRRPVARFIDEHVPPGEPVVFGSPAGYQYLFVRPAAISYTHLSGAPPRYLGRARWAEIAAEILATRPRAMQLLEPQWRQLVAERPEIHDLYRRATPELFLLENP